MSIKITSASKSDTPLIQNIAIKTWNHTHLKVIGQEQVDYMLARIYTPESLSKQMDDGQVFLLIYSEDIPAGYISYSQTSQDRYHINKLYIDPDMHGKGYGKALLDEPVTRIKNSGGKIIDLHVNEHNTKAQNFYKNYGFKTIRLEHYPFEKYMLHDYLMEIEMDMEM
ncbi:N-acetyltransferase [soil metagenome]